MHPQWREVRPARASSFHLTSLRPLKFFSVSARIFSHSHHLMADASAPPRRRKSISADLFRTIMNRFLKKKGTSEGPTANDEALQAFSAPPPPQPTSPGLKKSGTRRWMRRKEQPEPKPELNIAAALPDTNDFRTSLLMPNLSARFSMLRDQDDPRSLIGKASDDSVLQPRRRSRMNDLGFGSSNLGDIAEVSSIKDSSSSIRPPFAASRQDSFGSEAGRSEDDGGDGSIMSRARRGEGNTMFGGRQKVYMIGGGAASTKSLGKQVYEDDIKMSAFQKYRRQRELEEGRVSDESQGFDFGLDRPGAGEQDATTPNDSAKDLSHSPSLSSYERKRSTASTSHSDARSSTAATSVASQPATTNTASPAVMPTHPPAPVPAMPLKRSDTKARRLYEQGLDQHMQEQQTSALSRLNSIQRQRTLNGGKQGPPFLHSAKSASNLHENTRQPVYAVRSQSPTPVSPLPQLTTFASVGMSSPNLTGSGPQSPTSPQAGHFDEDQFLNSTLDPADRGKATAMGHFDKPKQAFNEQQYLERQRQLQRANSNAAAKKDVPSTSAFQQRMGRFEQDRQRSDSQASTRSRSRSIPKKEPTKAYNVFQRAANQIQAQPGAQAFDKSNLPDTHRTFFGDISASDSEDEEEAQPQPQQPPPRNNFMPQYQQDYGYGSGGRWQPTPLPSVSEHPALRGQKSKASLAEEDEFESPQLRDPPSSRSLKTDTETVKARPSVDEFDSPTIPTNVQPLNGMMQHLRQRSNQSSIFPGDEGPPADRDVPEMPQWNAQNFDLGNRPMRNTVDSESRIASTYTSSNPWDLEETDSRMSRASISPIDESRNRDLFSARAPSRQTGRERESEVVSPLPAEDEPERETAPEGHWQNELRKHHTRDASNATQQERDAFANELAARRTAIQENMKSIVESSSRGTSPAPSGTGARKALGMLRSRPSRESMDVPRPQVGPGPQGPPKAMKMLGLGSQGNNASSNTLNSQYERSTSSFDIGRSRENFGPPPPIPMPTQTPRGFESPRAFESQRERELSRSRGDSGASGHARDQVHPTGRSPPSSQSGRSRANSEATRGGRSRSRTGPYRDDLDKAMAEGTGTSAAALPDLSPMIPRELTPRPSPEIAQGQFEPPNRPRTNSRAGMTNYFDQKNNQQPPPIHPALQKERLHAAAGPSPISLSPNVSSARPSPTSPFTQNMTPPLSGSNTPTFGQTPVSSPPIQPSQVIPPNRTGPLRKKTVSKADISEPTLVSYTSNIDTFDLPEHVSLKNGMEDVGPPPPVPPINPRRRAANRLFSIGRKDTEEKEKEKEGPSSSSAAVNMNRSKTPDPWMSRAPEPDFPFDVARGAGAHDAAGRQRSSSRPPGPQQAMSSPGVREFNGFASPTGVGGSPERVQRPPVHPVPVEGGMF